MGTLDRIVRLIVAVAIGLLYYFEVINGIVAGIAIVAAGIFFLTSCVSFCPLYFPFKFSTRKKQ